MSVTRRLLGRAVRLAGRSLRRAGGIDRRQIKRRRLQHDQDALEQSSARAMSDKEYAAAIDLACSFLKVWPAERVGFRLLGEALKKSGDEETAKEVFLGRLPASLQEQRFAHPGLLSSEVSTGNTDVVISDVHQPESIEVRSSVAHNTPSLSSIAARGLTSSASRMIDIVHGRLWYDGFNAIAFDANGQYVADGLLGNTGPVLHAMDAVKPVQIRGTAVLLGARGTGNWFHWLTDILPKLGVLEKAGFTSRKDFTFIVPGLIRPFQRQTLATIGITQQQIYETSLSGCHVQADRLLLPLLDNRLCIGMGRWQAPYIQSLLSQNNKRVARSNGTDTDECSAGGCQHPGAGRRLFVSRDQSGSGRRLIANLDAVHALYESHGYEVVYPDRYPVDEQVAMFAAASHVAGPHGAGLANIIFCKPGTVVQEFYGSHLAPCYWAMSEICGFDYYNCPGDEALTAAESQDSLSMARSLDERRASGFRVSMELLESMLRASEAGAAARSPTTGA